MILNAVIKISYFINWLEMQTPIIRNVYASNLIFLLDLCIGYTPIYSTISDKVILLREFLTASFRGYCKIENQTQQF